LSAIPTVRKTKANYENIFADCPWCNFKCIFNRQSDLKTLKPIAGIEVECLNEACRQHFRVSSDFTHEKYEWLIYGCHDLLEQKQYIFSIASLCMAYEVFFATYTRAKLIYTPFFAGEEHNTSKLNEAIQKLEEKIKTFTFQGMKSLFLYLITKETALANLEDAVEIINNLSKSTLKDADVSAIETLNDAELVTLLKELNHVKINDLRNRVIHKSAYRPKDSEVDEELNKARSILFPLGTKLNIHDDPNCYNKTYLLHI